MLLRLDGPGSVFAKLADFGLTVRRHEAAEEDWARDRGTPRYMWVAGWGRDGCMVYGVHFIICVHARCMHMSLGWRWFGACAGLGARPQARPTTCTCQATEPESCGLIQSPMSSACRGPEFWDDELADCIGEAADVGAILSG